MKDHEDHVDDLEPVKWDGEEPEEEQHLDMRAYEEMIEQNNQERKKRSKAMSEVSSISNSLCVSYDLSISNCFF